MQASKAILSAVQKIETGWAALDSIGPCLIAWRKERDQTAKNFAEALGISAQYLSDVEHGRRAASREVIRKIKELL